MAESKGKELDSMTISPAKNGGHTIRHSYKAQPVMRKGSMSGGLGMDYPQSEEHVFGPNDGKKALAHIAKHLGIGGGKSAAGKDAPPADPEGMNEDY